MNIAGGDETHTKTLGLLSERTVVLIVACFGDVAEVAQCCDVLGRTRWPVLEGGLLAVAALSRVEPILAGCTGDGHLGRDAGFHRVALGFFGAEITFARALAHGEASSAHDFPGSVAEGQIVGLRLGAYLRSTLGVLHGPPVAVDLVLAVPRVDFEQRLTLGVVVRVGQLVFPIRSRRRVDPPGGAVGNHDGVVSPLIELSKEFSGSGGDFPAIVGKRSDMVVLANFHSADARPASSQIVHAPPALEGEGAPGPDRGRMGGDSSRGGRDGPARDLPFAVSRKHNVLVSVVVFRREASLGPLPPHEGHHVGCIFAAREGVALSDGLEASSPIVGVDIGGVIVERIKIERCAVAGEITGIGGGVSAFAAHQGEVEHESIEGNRGVDVQIAEENLTLGVSRALASKIFWWVRAGRIVAVGASARRAGCEDFAIRVPKKTAANQPDASDRRTDQPKEQEAESPSVENIDSFPGFVGCPFSPTESQSMLSRLTLRCLPQWLLGLRWK